jgi:hypothetical protein
MKKEGIIKTLAIIIIILFISVSFKPIIAEETISAKKTSEHRNVDFKEAKEYLLQTLVEISNNLEVKTFLNEHKRDLIRKNNNNYDFRNSIQKIYNQNPKLLKSILFTKPEMTVEYLEKIYKKGLELYDILGNEESFDIAESISITNPELFNEIKNIIINNKELSDRISNLKQINNDLKSNFDFWEFPIICGILHIIAFPAILIANVFAFSMLLLFLTGNPIFLITLLISFLFLPLVSVIELIIVIPYYLFGCNFLDEEVY